MCLCSVFVKRLRQLGSGQGICPECKRCVRHIFGDKLWCCPKRGYIQLREKNRLLMRAYPPFVVDARCVKNLPFLPFNLMAEIQAWGDEVLRGARAEYPPKWMSLNREGIPSSGVCILFLFRRMFADKHMLSTEYMCKQKMGPLENGPNSYLYLLFMYHHR